MTIAVMTFLCLCVVVVIGLVCFLTIRRAKRSAFVREPLSGIKQVDIPPAPAYIPPSIPQQQHQTSVQMMQQHQNSVHMAMLMHQMQQQQHQQNNPPTPPSLF